MAGVVAADEGLAPGAHPRPSTPGRTTAACRGGLPPINRHPAHRFRAPPCQVGRDAFRARPEGGHGVDQCAGLVVQQGVGRRCSPVRLQGIAAPVICTRAIRNSQRSAGSQIDAAAVGELDGFHALGGAGLPAQHRERIGLPRDADAQVAANVAVGQLPGRDARAQVNPVRSSGVVDRVAALAKAPGVDVCRGR